MGPTGCAGARASGHCWHLGGKGESCSSVCGDAHNVDSSATQALASSEEVVVPERQLTEAELAKVAERKAAAAERKAAVAEKEARASAEGAQQQVRAAIEAGELKGLSVPEWELLISSASSA